MLVAISGSQGAGKSTVLENLKKKYNYRVVERKTSRSILQEWNVSLQEVNSNPELTLKFQDEILSRKLEDERSATMSSQIWLTERTYTDLFVYALISLGLDNAQDKWLNEYYRKCQQFNKYYDGVFYLKGGLFDVVHDGTRGSNHHYSKMVDLTMEHYTNQMNHPSKISTLTTADLEDRTDTIHAQILQIIK